MSVLNIKDDDEQESSEEVLLADVCGGISYEDAETIGIVKFKKKYSFQQNNIKLSESYMKMEKYVKDHLVAEAIGMVKVKKDSSDQENNTRLLDLEKYVKDCLLERLSFRN